MNELIRIEEKDGKKLVSAIELYSKLGLSLKHYAKWYDKNIVKNDFAIENEDYTELPLSGRRKDFALVLDFAKKISMLCRNEEGERIRNYFIECEKIAKDMHEINSHKLPMSYKDALLALVASEEEKEVLLLQNENLNTVLDNLLEWVSIIKVCEHNQVKESNFNWRNLKSKSNELGYQIKRAESPRFGYMNLYHIDAFRACYPQFDYNINKN